MNDINKTLSAINDIETKLLPVRYLNEITYIFYAANEYYLNHSRSALNELYDYLLSLSKDVKWPDYYQVQRGELSSNVKINRQLEEVINLYFSLVKKYTELVYEFAVNIHNKSKNMKKLYQDLSLVREAVYSFNPNSMAIGLSSEISHDSFSDDIVLMRLINNYFETGKVNKWEIKKLKGYPRIYPWAKVEIYKKMDEISKEEIKNNKEYTLLKK